MIVLLNPRAGGGRARERWQRIQAGVRQRLGPFTLVVAETPETLTARVAAALTAGEREFVAAGGDGTVNAVMTALLAHAPRGALSSIKLGAIGLGSSNDFHKPLNRERTVDGLPFRLDFLATVQHDVGLLTYRDDQDQLRSRRWLINASVGTAAEANRLFNSSERGLNLLKRVAPGVAMVYAALRTVFGFRCREMTLTIDESETVHTSVKNLGVVKNPHFTGALRYDSPYEPGSGHFFVHLLGRTSLPCLVVALGRLLLGRFAGQTGARSWRATRLRIEADRPFVVEGDGEVVTARKAYFTLVPDLLQVAT